MIRYLKIFVVITLVFVAAASAKPPVTAVIGALEMEVLLLKQELENAVEEEILGLIFTTGDISGRDVVLVRSGIGKVNAAMTVTILIYHFQPSEVIFTGVSGGLNPDLYPGDIVIGEKSFQHDYGMWSDEGIRIEPTTRPDNWKDNPLMFLSDRRLIEIAREAAENMKLEPIDYSGRSRNPVILTGIVATGDVFVTSSEKKHAIRKDFKADAVEMEGAAVAQICSQTATPFLLIRSLSDRADENTSVDFKKFSSIAAANSARLVIEILKLLPKKE